jgi:hypothetical protein
MANSLSKTIILHFTPGVNAIAPIPASPAYSAFVTQIVNAFRSVSSSGNSITGDLTGAGVVLTSTTQEVLVQYPAVAGRPGTPGTPAVVSTDYGLGWNAGARSVTMFFGDGYVQFQARASMVGAIAGINAYDGVASSYNGTTIDNAFKLARGVARVMENGVDRGVVGSYTDDTIFRVTRTGTTVVYAMNGTTVFTTTGVSAAPAWLEASLFSGGDQLFNPSLVQVSAANATAQHGSLSASLPRLVMNTTQGPHGALNATLPLLALASNGGFVAPAYGILSAALAPLFMSGHGLTGQTGTFNASLPPMQMLATNRPYGAFNGVLPKIIGSAYALEGNTNATIASFVGVSATMTTVSLLVVAMNASGTISSVFVTQVQVPVSMVSSGTAGSTLLTSATLTAIMQSIAAAAGATAVGPGSTPSQDGDTWVYNLDSNGSTNYTDYAFNSYARLGDAYFGAARSGLFLLDGDTDDGLPINANVSFGVRDFGTATKKTVTECYVGMAGADNLYVKVVANGEQYIYATRNYTNVLRQQRVTFGKGLRTNYIELELYNHGGAYFELDTIEFQVADLTRRI